MKECTVKDKLNNVKNMKYSVLMTVYSGADTNHFYQAVKSMICQTIIPEQIVISVDGKLTKSLEKIICYYKNKYKNKKSF